MPFTELVETPAIDVSGTLLWLVCRRFWPSCSMTAYQSSTRHSPACTRSAGRAGKAANPLDGKQHNRSLGLVLTAASLAEGLWHWAAAHVDGTVVGSALCLKPCTPVGST